MGFDEAQMRNRFGASGNVDNICRNPPDSMLYLPESAAKRLESILMRDDNQTIKISSYGDSVMHGGQDFWSYCRGKRLGYQGFAWRFTDFLSEMYYDQREIVHTVRARAATSFDHLLMCETHGEDSDIILLETRFEVADSQDEQAIQSKIVQSTSIADAFIRYLLQLPHKPIVILVEWQRSLQVGVSPWYGEGLVRKFAEHYSIPSVTLNDGSWDETLKELYYDEIHPNTIGHKTISCVLESMIKKSLVSSGEQSSELRTRSQIDDALPEPLVHSDIPVDMRPTCYNTNADDVSMRLPTPVRMDDCWKQQQINPGRETKRWFECDMAGGVVEFSLSGVSTLFLAYYLQEKMGESTSVFVNGRQTDINSNLDHSLAKWAFMPRPRGLAQFLKLDSGLDPSKPVNITIRVNDDQKGLHAFQLHSLAFY